MPGLHQTLTDVLQIKVSWGLSIKDVCKKGEG